MASTRTIDCATETSRIGSEITTASASITRYCEPNQLALTTLGLVLPLISPPTFWRNHWPAADTAAVKLRSALSPAADTTPVAAPLRALPTERPAPAPASQIWRAIGVCTPAHLSVCWVLCCGVVVVVGACWASAAGATTSTDRRARPITSRSQRPRERSRSWSIVIILELLKLVDEVRGRGRRVAVGDGDRPVRDGGAGLLPILVDPLELHGGHAPGFLGRQARVLVAAHAGLPDGDAGVGAVVGVEAVADGDGLEDDLAGDYLGQRLVGVVDSEEGGGDQLRLVLQVAPEPLARLRGRDRADGARLGMVPTDGHAVDGPPAPHLLAVDGQRARRRQGGRRRALRRRGARGGRTDRTHPGTRGGAARAGCRSPVPGSAHVRPPPSPSIHRTCHRLGRCQHLAPRHPAPGQGPPIHRDTAAGAPDPSGARPNGQAASGGSRLVLLRAQVVWPSENAQLTSAAAAPTITAPTIEYSVARLPTAAWW